MAGGRSARGSRRRVEAACRDRKTEPSFDSKSHRNGTRPASQVADFLGAVDAGAGRPTVVYLGEDFRSMYGTDELTGHPLWLSHFMTPPSETWQVWQVDGFAKVAGIQGRVDLDVMAQLR